MIDISPNQTTLENIVIAIEIEINFEIHYKGYSLNSVSTNVAML